MATNKDSAKTPENIAAKLKSMGLAPAAIFMLESHLPLRGLFYNLSHLGQPLIAPFCGLENYSELQELLQDQSQLDSLLELLEAN